jgi:hypothetical protein
MRSLIKCRDRRNKAFAIAVRAAGATAFSFIAM